MRKFKWEKWIDPLGSNLDEVHFPGYDQPDPEGGIKPFEMYCMDGSPPVDAMLPEDISSQMHKIAPKKIINTKLGLMTVFDSSLTQYHFDLWLLHCNFDVEEQDAEAIAYAPGVETFEVLTRYCCRIGFPKSGLFDVTECKKNIEDLLRDIGKNKISNKNQEQLPTVFNKNTEQKIEEKLQELEKFPYWLLYVFPNGNIKAYSSVENDENFEKCYTTYADLYQKVGGRLYTY